jgi:hypothetical protein
MANLILIGPMGVGKSTVADWIHTLTGRNRVSLDDDRHPHFSRNLPGFTGSGLSPQNVPFMTAYRSWKPFEVTSVERHLGAVDNHVIDFGAGHSVYEDPAQFKRVVRAVAGHHVALLMPDTDWERSRKFLIEQHPRANADFINHVLDNPSNKQLADVIVGREAKSAKEVAIEVLEHFPTWWSAHQ